MIDPYNFFKQFLSPSNKYSGRNLLERRIIKLYGENYNSSYLKLLKESNPISYKRLNKLMAIAVRKNKKEKNKMSSRIELFLEK